MFDTIHGVIADMDGVLWRGDDPLPGASEFFQYLHGRIPYVFATNNSSRTAHYYVEKLTKLQIPVQTNQIITSSSATAAYLVQTYPDAKTAYVVGEIGIRSALQEYGFTLVQEGTQPDIVVAGIDRDFDYQKLKLASDYIRNGAVFIGTNSDKTLPVPNGFVPGAGSILAAITAASGNPPAHIIGKPEPPMFEVGLMRLGTPPNKTLMIGDRMETDILGAARLGIKTALLLSGVTTEKAIIENSEVQPDMIYEDLAAFLRSMLA